MRRNSKIAGRKSDCLAMTVLSVLGTISSAQVVRADDLMSWPSEGTAKTGAGTAGPASTQNNSSGASNSAGANRGVGDDQTIMEFPEGGSAAAERRGALKEPQGESAEELQQQSGNKVPQRSEPQSRPVDEQNRVRSLQNNKMSSGKTLTLFGRIDQIAAEADVKLPELKMQTATLDTRYHTPQRVLRSQASEARFSGNIASSFPIDFSGTWGGTIRVWRYSASTLSYQLDSAESEKMQKILTPGTAGDVNFVFTDEAGGRVGLEPTQVRIMIPATESYSYQKMTSEQGQLGSMGPMVSQMMANMKVPVMLHFGSVSTRGSMEVGVSGNQIDQRVVKNEIRQLAANVLEEQIVTSNRSIQSSGHSEDGYTESVLRFTRQSPTQLYVLAASVDYSASGKFLRKLIMYGNVYRGQVMDTNPYPAAMGNLQEMLNSQGGGGSMGGYSSILNTLGSVSGGATNYGSDGSGLSSYMNNPAVRQYLEGNGRTPSHLEGFSQILNNLNMLSQ